MAEVILTIALTVSVMANIHLYRQREELMGEYFKTGE